MEGTAQTDFEIIPLHLKCRARLRDRPLFVQIYSVPET